MELSRPSLDEYFIGIVKEVGKRSTCRRHQVGAVAVRDKFILTTGYNGAPSNTKDCLELGCLRDTKGITTGEKHEICRAVHAEQNVVIQAALHGVSLEGSTIYCLYSPCILCAKILVNSKIERYVYLENYPDILSIKLFEEAGVKIEHLNCPPM